MTPDDLFGEPPAEDVAPAAHAPLAERMRPRSLDEYAGQQHILGPGKLLRRAIAYLEAPPASGSWAPPPAELAKMDEPPF